MSTRPVDGRVGPPQRVRDDTRERRVVKRRKRSFHARPSSPGRPLLSCLRWSCSRVAVTPDGRGRCSVPELSPGGPQTALRAAGAHGICNRTVRRQDIMRLSMPAALRRRSDQPQPAWPQSQLTRTRRDVPHDRALDASVRISRTGRWRPPREASSRPWKADCRSGRPSRTTPCRSGPCRARRRSNPYP